MVGMYRTRGVPVRIRKKASFWTSVGIGAVLLCLTCTPMLTNTVGITSDGQSLRRGGACGGDGGSVYPDDLIMTKPYNEDPYRYAVALHCIGIIYMLIGLNTVCDVCFSGALEVMVEEWEVQPDVAGATFMAAGGSAPELFTSLIGVFAESDVGFGTIVGSAVFNVLFVIGLCGYFAKDGIALSVWPLARDCSYYLFGLGMLAWCAADEEIHTWEAIMLFALYLIYLLIMWKNVQLEQWFTSKFGGAAAAAAGEPETAGKKDEGSAKVAPLEPEPELSSPINSFSDLDKNETQQNQLVKLDPLEAGANEEDVADKPDGGAEVEDGAEGEEEEEDEEHMLDIPEEMQDKIIWYICCPIYFLLHYLTPEPTTEVMCLGVKRFIVTFIVSLLWIAFFSYFLVWWTEVLGQVLGVDTIIMGFTLLAAGTSIPDAVSSVHFAAIGEGDMAISSSIGSNIFDILVGLPIPWLLKTGIVDPIKDGAMSTVTICSPYITAHVLLLLFMVLAVVLSIHHLNWVLNRTLGMIMGVLYLIFLLVACSVEFAEPEWLKF